MEKYTVYLLRSGSLYWWEGRKWGLRPYKAKCYGTQKEAEKALENAVVKALETPVSVVKCTLEVPK
jgi:hypothetical protein